LPIRLNQIREEFLDFTRGTAPGCAVIAGNHDPDISTLHKLELLGGSRLHHSRGGVVRGSGCPGAGNCPDQGILSPGTPPRSRPMPREMPDERLAAAKRACARLELLDDPPSSAPMGTVPADPRIFWPPHRTLAMIKAWRQLPDRATAFARQYHPESVSSWSPYHMPGVWTRSDIVVINTAHFARHSAVTPSTFSQTNRRARSVALWRMFRFGTRDAAFALAPTGMDCLIPPECCQTWRLHHDHGISAGGLAMPTDGGFRCGGGFLETPSPGAANKGIINPGSLMGRRPTRIGISSWPRPSAVCHDACFRPHNLQRSSVCGPNKAHISH